MDRRLYPAPHPVFEPQQNKDNLATQYLLWMLAEKTYIKPSGCWYWGGNRNEKGYGLLEVRGVIYRIHRIVYEHCVGEVSESDLVLHHCDNPPCCNPSHLYIGDHRDNILDCVRRNRHPASILNEEMVREIRNRSTGSSRQSAKRLAEIFGVSVDAIQDVLTRRTWQHVE